MNNQKVCQQCGTPFEGRSNRLYCSDACKQRAFQQNQQATAEQPATRPDLLRKRSTGSRTDSTAAKADIEIARLRLASEEKLKVLEAEERQRERQHELLRQDREFEQEMERANAKHEVTKQAWNQERNALLNRLDGLEKRLTDELSTSSHKYDDEQEDEKPKSSNMNSLLWIAGGIALLSMFANKGNQAQPALIPPVNTPKKPLASFGTDPKNG